MGCRTVPLTLGLLVAATMPDTSAFAEADRIPINLVVNVFNDAGEATTAGIRTVPLSCGLRVTRKAAGVYEVKGDYRVSWPSPPGAPFLLEVVSSGYKARVLEFGRDFTETDEAVRVELETGPFERTESVFSTVTGRPATDEEVAAMPHARTIRLRERDYRYQAAKGRLPESEMPPEPRQHGAEVWWGERSPPPPETGSLLPVMAQSLKEATDLPVIKVLDSQGSPIDRVYVQWAWLREPREETGELIPTPHGDSDVRALFSPDGVFAVPNNCLVWSDGTEQVFVPAPESEDPAIREIVLTSHEEQTRGWMARLIFGRESDHPEISRAEAQEIIEALKDSASSNRTDGRRRFQEVLRQIRTYRITQAAPALRTLLLEWEIRREFDFWHTDELVATLVEIRGDREIRFLERTASDTAVDPLIRRSAVIGLGMIGSERSVAAFRRLRDAARSLPDAPQANESYTHTERICEAVTMACVLIPGLDPKSRVAFRAVPHTASVGGDYSTAYVYCGWVLQSTRVELRRFGDEWLVVKIGPTTM